MPKKIATLFLFALAVTTFSPAHADVSFSSPASDTTLQSCADFATDEIGNPFDMNDSSDVNNFFLGTDVQGLGALSFSGGVFSATTTTNAPLFYLWSPVACGAYPIGGRYGQSLNLNTSKYKSLSFRMYSSVSNLDGAEGLRMIWDHDCNYANSRTVTNPVPIKMGWNTYTLDLTSDVTPSAAGQATWTGAAVTGFGVLPIQTVGANLIFDWIRLEDPSSCGSGSVDYTASANANGGLLNLYLDDDTDPFNGYSKLIARNVSASGNPDSVSVDTLGLAPGSYNVLGLLDSDYATVMRSDPWDMEQSSDVLITTGLSGATFSGGTLSATTDSSGGSTIYLRLGDTNIDASKFNHLSVGITRSSTAQPMLLLWRRSDSGSWFGYSISEAAKFGATNIYQLDLSASSDWTGEITTLVLRPTIEAAAVSFSLDFLSLRASGYDNVSRTSSTLASHIQTAAAQFVVDTPPLVTFLSPTEKSGEALRPWNMKSGDLPVWQNLSSEADAANQGELLTSYLPDVRLVDGLRGDFFKGTNSEGNNDPDNYSTFPFGNPSPVSFSAADYHNLCFKLFIDRPFSLGEGSVGRVIWQPTDNIFRTSEDLPLITDGWSGANWYEYCADLNDLPLEGTGSPDWSGTIQAFRIDPHEFTPATTYYFDYIKLRKDLVAGAFVPIVWSVSAADTTPSVSFYYTAATSPQIGDSLIAAQSATGTNITLWDTSSVPDGTYHIYAKASNGHSTTTTMTSGAIILNSPRAPAVTPIVSLEAPLANDTVCSALQIKGFALDAQANFPIPALKLLMDGNPTQIFQTGLYSPQAVSQYPLLDSSNAGFNFTVDISGLSDGAHQVEVVALSATGAEATTGAIDINKGSSGCAAIIQDPDPAGAPDILPYPGAATPTPPPTPLPTTSAPSIKSLSLSSSGTLSFTLSNATLSGKTCTDTLYVGADKNKVSSRAKAFKNKKTTIKIKVGGIKLNTKKLKSFALKVSKSCSGYRTSTSSIKTVKAKARGSIASVSSLAKALSKLKVQ